MKKKLLDENLLREAVCRAVEEEWQRVNDEVKKSPHTFSPEFHEKMRQLFASVGAFGLHNPSDAADAEEPFLKQLAARPKKRPSPWMYRRWIAIIALLMLGASGAALASDDIRKGLYQLQYQFFEDNVTIEATPENGMEKDDDNAASEEFHAYKWKEVPEGYEVVQEEDDAELRLYRIDYENSKSNFIHYMQNDASLYTTSITYDEEKGYKHKIRLRDDLEAYSISDGRRNTIFYENDGYLFEFMSDQPEETILEYIEMSGVLEYGN